MSSPSFPVTVDYSGTATTKELHISLSSVSRWTLCTHTQPRFLVTFSFTLFWVHSVWKNLVKTEPASPSLLLRLREEGEKKREALKLGRMKERSDTRGDTQNSTLFSSKTVTGGEWLCTSSFLGCSLWPYQFVKNKVSGMGKKCHVLLVWFDFLFFIVGNIRRPQIRCIIHK